MKYHFVATEITDIFYQDGQKDKERSHGSEQYWKHVCAIEDIIARFMQNNDLTLEEKQ